MKNFFIFLSCIFFLFIAGGIYFVVQLNSFLNTPSPVEVTLMINKGESLRMISKQLTEAHVISNARYFEIEARLTKQAHLIKAGEYEFKAGSMPLDILEKLVKGEVKTYSLTIPEGWSFKDILNELQKHGFDTSVITPTTIQNLISKYHLETPSLEGTLFPNTYLYNRETTTLELIESMITLFQSQLTPTMKELAKTQGLSVNQWITLASIVEKETGQAAERPLIASVFLNRLKIGMLLQTDPTVIYGISLTSQFNGNLTRNDLQRDTPYNTYTRAGLPPGPICSPGLDALKAVLNPTPTEALYFVAKGDGTHYFSKTLEEHNAAVRQYQLH